MLNSLINAFTQGDLSGLNSKLLHSTCWSQHNTKGYGEDQLKSIPLNWLTLAGRCQLITSNSVSANNQSVINLQLGLQNTKQPVNYTFWLETNGQVIKYVEAMLDTKQLALANNQSIEQVIQALPCPDTFVLQDYDQQDHLQEEFAKPSNVAQLSEQQATLLDNWWEIWSKAQLASIDSVYQADADIQLPGLMASTNRNGLFDFVLNKFSHLSRAFAQIEKVVVEDNNVAIKWFLDGDEKGQRIRAPFISMLTIDNSQIKAELTTTDILAYTKRFSQSALFND
jgi:hypothetical protein